MREQPMSDEKPMGQVIQIDEARIGDHLGELVRGAVEGTLNARLDAEADQVCGAGRYERSQARQDTRAGSYERTLQTSAGEVNLKVPKLRRQTFETAIIARYPRRPSACPRPDAERRRVLARISLAPRHGAFLWECIQPRSSDQSPRGEPYAQGYPCPGEPGRGRPKGARHRRRPAHRQDEHGGRSRRAERVRNAHLLRLPGHPLAEDTHQQPARADHARDSSADPCRWSIPRRPVMPQPGGRATALHRRHRMVHQVLHEHAASLSAATHANRSRRLIKCAKDSGHYRTRCWMLRRTGFVAPDATNATRLGRILGLAAMIARCRLAP